MSIISSRGRRGQQLSAEPAGASGRYMTDGTNLYRRATEARSIHGFVWLEDCLSLELLFIPEDAAADLQIVTTP